MIDFGNLVSYNPYKLRMTFFMDEDAVTKTQEVQVNGSIPKSIIFQGIYQHQVSMIDLITNYYTTKSILISITLETSKNLSTIQLI